jgi:Fe2+ transport system protein B
MVLALNMFDIAERQGLRIDFDRLAAALGVPIVTTTATRKRGIPDLIVAIEAAAAPGWAELAEGGWSAPDAAALRVAHGRAEQIMRDCVRPPERPDTATGRIDAVLLHPVGGLVILLALLFVMFQAVFAWASPAMDAIEAGFVLLGTAVAAVVPDTGPLWPLVQSLIVDGLIAGVGGVLVFLPQIIILFAFIILLEDLGYMARAAFLMDRIMGGAGLHGLGPADLAAEPVRGPIPVDGDNRVVAHVLRFERCHPDSVAGQQSAQSGHDHRLAGVGRGSGDQQCAAHGKVRISAPSSVTTMVCSNWAVHFRSLVATVQPSDQIS